MAGTVSESLTCDIAPVKVVTFTCTADSSDGSFPATSVSANVKGRLLQIATNPGATAPQDNYDITITDGDGIDVLQGVGANRDTSNSEVAAIVYATSANPVVAETDTLTLNVTGNNVNSAVTVIKLYWTEGV
jgi:hypothetical protein